MKRRVQWKLGTDASGNQRRGIMPIVIQPTEGRVAAEKDKRSKEDYLKLWESVQGNLEDAWQRDQRRRRKNARHDPAQEEWEAQTIRLKTTGTQMELSRAIFVLEALRMLQERSPDDFTAFVAWVKPRGATHPLGKVSSKAVSRLESLGIGDPNQEQPHPDYAAMLDAAYVESRDGVVLRDPIIYPDIEEYFDKSGSVDSRAAAARAEARRILEELEKRYGKPGPGKGGGQAR